MYFLLTATVLVVLGFLTLRLLRGPVLRGKALSWFRPFYLWIYPPAGLYDRIEVGHVDLSRPGVLKFEFSPKYSGEHELGISAERRIEMPKKSYDFGLTGTVTALANGVVCWTKSVGSNPLPWWGSSASGFTLATFLVPRDLPLDQASQFIFRVESASPQFEKEYGKAIVYVSMQFKK